MLFKNTISAVVVRLSVEQPVLKRRTIHISKLSGRRNICLPPPLLQIKHLPNFGEDGGARGEVMAGWLRLPFHSPRTVC